MGHPHVLLCESDDALRSVLQYLFADEGIEVMLCASLEEIEQRLAVEQHAVVVTDSWTGSVRHLSASDREGLTRVASSAPVVLTTARPWTADVAALGLGEAVMVLDKPYDLDDLLACVRQAERRAWGQP
jgi:DNA-binding NtrC family response regulator